MKPLVALAVLFFAAGCAPTMTFNSDTAETIPARPHSASRLAHANAGCETIGTLTFDGRQMIIVDSDIEAIADKVASVGGTHYVVRNRTRMTHSGKTRPDSPVVDVLVCSSATARARGGRRM